MWPFSARYNKVPSVLGDEASFEGSEEEEADHAQPSDTVFQGHHKRPGAKQVLPVLLVLSNIALFAFSAYNLNHAGKLLHVQGAASSDENAEYRRADLNEDLKKTSAYSPIFDSLNLNPKMLTFNGALRDNSSIWRKPPSPEVDKAWDYLATEGLELITVSSDDLRKSGKDPEKCVKAPTSWGEGSDAYIAQIETFHQIHCLNELRKSMYYDYYYKTPPNELYTSHKAHCVHMLLQVIMCSADVGLISHNWVHNERIQEPKTRPMADFNMVKKCRDFDALLDWAREKGTKDLSRKWKLLKHEPGMPIVPGDGYA
ncbi:hypothetical protein B0T19DRAFT_469476 [Cercophora scortea]|uniref:Tat pathway signal sequence n=1 Tax=Cercophora scortea TaxID=314031 RepID=A0AAE0I515_9PEZI|nr:hypothetical protein B0T19DRAFT_469476 [Cercophora scortea]